VAGADRKAEPAASLAEAGYALTALVAYAAEAVPALPDSVCAAFAADGLDAALHYSRRSASVALECAETAGYGGAFGALRHYCLSDDVAGPLEAAGVPVHFVATRPREDELLAALR
ncbi:uroporphyrinogen-III synthase, partial [Methylobacterium trifolii]